ncbi:MAG: 2-succinyl-6-hydroxy-2,4-cyclohexadiene-1-carboxylate synthase [Chloroflexi bacterium]|nr:2-succinyl-6-hydroxy-2,4-cyclohexadiene-1-carboxylate synthase [Chloroflexota bacterium]
MVMKALGGVHLNLEDWGAPGGPPVLALHGFTGSAATWWFLAEAICNRYRLLAVDVQGHGGSDSHPDPRLYTMERTVQALEEVLDRLDLERVHWLGYSMGGRIALSAAVALPDRTASLVLESASPGLRTPQEQALRVQDDMALAERILQGGIEVFVNYWQSIPLWASQARLAPEVKARLRAQRLDNNRLGLANSLRGIGTGAQPALHDRLGEISAPTLFLAGEEDSRYAAIAREMHEAVAGSRLCIIKEAGHAAHLEQPQAFIQAVETFWGGVTLPRPGKGDLYRL